MKRKKGKMKGKKKGKAVAPKIRKVLIAAQALQRNQMINPQLAQALLQAKENQKLHKLRKSSRPPSLLGCQRSSERMNMKEASSDAGIFFMLNIKLLFNHFSNLFTNCQ